MKILVVHHDLDTLACQMAQVHTALDHGGPWVGELHPVVVIVGGLIRPLVAASSVLLKWEEQIGTGGYGTNIFREV